jgi:hypothetical protein
MVHELRPVSVAFTPTTIDLVAPQALALQGRPRQARAGQGMARHGAVGGVMETCEIVGSSLSRAGVDMESLTWPGLA